MAVAVAGERKQKRDVFDLLLTGLQAASAFTNIQRARAEMENIPVVQKRLKRQEEAEFAADFQTADASNKAALEVTNPQTGKVGFYIPRTAATAQSKSNAAAQKDQINFFEKFTLVPEGTKNAVSLQIPGTTQVGLFKPLDQINKEKTFKISEQEAKTKEKLDNLKMEKLRSEIQRDAPLVEPGELGRTDTGKPQTGEQLKAEGYYTRMAVANNLLDKIGIDKPVDNALLLGYIDASRTASTIPIIGGAIESFQSFTRTTPSSILDAKGQQYLAASMDWTRAKLRKESGAVIGTKEASDEYKTYFPVAGDSPETIEFKRKLRAIATENMMKETGRTRKREPVKFLDPELSYEQTIQEIKQDQGAFSRFLSGFLERLDLPDVKDERANNSGLTIPKGK